VSANDTKETAKPPMTTGIKSANETQGMVNVGKPPGSEPSTEMFARSAKSKKYATAVAPIIATRMPGKRLRRLTSKITTRVATPSANSTQLTFPPAIAPAIDQISLKGPALLILNPNSLGS
jgi:hypothetical protein